MAPCKIPDLDHRPGAARRLASILPRIRIEGRDEDFNARNEGTGLPGPEAYRGGRRVARQQPPSSRQTDLSPLEADRPRRFSDESEHAELRGGSMLSRLEVDPGRGGRRSG